MSSELSTISQDFIKENQNLVRPMQKSSAPYSKKDRFRRRQEVWRLHLDLGYHAVKIADMMNVNRNTINSDIKHLYSKLAIDWDKQHITALAMKQMARLEIQRTRLRQEIDNQSDLQTRLSAEKLILEIDDKIAKMMLNIVKTTEVVRDASTSTVNKWMDENEFQGRLIGKWEVERAPKENFEKVKQLLKSKIRLLEG